MAQFENGLQKDSFVNQTQNHVIFGVSPLAEPGLMADVQQNFGESRISKKFALAQTILLSTFLLRHAITTAILGDSGWLFRIKSTVRFFKVLNFKNAYYF